MFENKIVTDFNGFVASLNEEKDARDNTKMETNSDPKKKLQIQERKVYVKKYLLN